MTADQSPVVTWGVTQTLLANDRPGVEGNCVQAALATVLGLPLDAVPHVNTFGRAWLVALNLFLTQRGRELVCYSTVDHSAIEGRYIVSGPSPRGVLHVCVAEKGEVVWDPHPSRAGLLDITETWVLVDVS